MKKLILSALLACPCFLNASSEPCDPLVDLSGIYEVEGKEVVCCGPNGSGKEKIKIPYDGTALLQLQNTVNNVQVYSIKWMYDDGSEDQGTGVREGHHMSVIYEDGPGVQHYKICCDSSGFELKGPWVDLGGECLSCEELEFIAPAPEPV